MAYGTAIASFLYDQSVAFLPATRTATAAVAASTTSLLGLPATRSGTLVLVKGGAVTYDITAGCTGLFIGLLLVTAVVAYPSTWRQKLPAVGLGVPLLLACNVVRLASMGFVGVYVPSLYEDLHLVYWQALLVLFVGIGFYAWTRSLNSRPSASEAPRIAG